jgi:hypothetical protein
MPTTRVRNDVAFDVLLMGMQTAPGTAAVPTFLADGKPDIKWIPPVTIEPEATGTYMTDITPVQGLPTNTGSWGEVAMTFERLPSLLRLLCKRGNTPFSGSGPDYLYKQIIDINGDDVDYATVYAGTKGLLEQYTDLRFGKVSMKWEPDGGGPWKITPDVYVGKGDIPAALTDAIIAAPAPTTTTFSVTGPMTAGALVGGYVFLGGDNNLPGARLISANTTSQITVDTPYALAPTAGTPVRVGYVPPAGIVPLAQNRIKAAGTKVYLDPATGTIGTTLIPQRIISGNVDVDLQLDSKAFSENEFERSGIYGRGSVKASGQLVIEADKPDEINQYRRMDRPKLRIEKLGPQIAPGVFMMLRIDVPVIVWMDRTPGTRNNNKTQQLMWQAISPTVPIEFWTRNTLATLPN